MQGKINNDPTKLEQARRAAGLSRMKLGELSGINYRTIEAWEQKRRDFSQASIIDGLKIADALKIDIRDLIDPIVD